MKFDHSNKSALDLEAILIAMLFWGAIIAGTGVAAAIAMPEALEENDPALAWHQWRGPNRDGSVGGAAWPADFSGLEKVWHVGLGKGYSGPIVTEDRVFAVETIEGKTASVRALDRVTGEEIWSRSWEAKGDVRHRAGGARRRVASAP